MTDIQMPQAVFWDWDGTLADSYNFLNDAHNFTLQSLGFKPFEQGEYRHYFGKPRDVLYPAIYKDKCEDAMDIFQGYILDNAHKIQVLDGGLDILDFFYSRNIKMGIVSNKKSSFIEKEIEHLGWGEYFDIVIGSGDAQSDKPSSAPLLLALEKAKVTVNKNMIWYIGDTENDLACAENTGCRAVFLKGTHDSAALIKQYNPHIYFDDYSQFKEILVAI